MLAECCASAVSKGPSGWEFKNIVKHPCSVLEVVRCFKCSYVSASTLYGWQNSESKEICIVKDLCVFLCPMLKRWLEISTEDRLKHSTLDYVNIYDFLHVISALSPHFLSVCVLYLSVLWPKLLSATVLNFTSIFFKLLNPVSMPSLCPLSVLVLHVLAPGQTIIHSLL